MCSRIDKANVHRHNKAYYKTLSAVDWALKFNIAQNNERMSVLSCVSHNGETMRSIFSGHIKMNYSCGGGDVNTVHCSCTRRWMENTQIIILIAFHLNEEISIFMS